MCSTFCVLALHHHSLELPEQTVVGSQLGFDPGNHPEVPRRRLFALPSDEVFVVGGSQLGAIPDPARLPAVRVCVE